MVCKNCGFIMETVGICSRCGYNNQVNNDSLKNLEDLNTPEVQDKIISGVRNVAKWHWRIRLGIFLGFIIVVNVLIWGLSKQLFNINFVFDCLKYVLLGVGVVLVFFLLKNIVKKKVLKVSTFVLGIGIFLILCVCGYFSFLPFEIKDYSKDNLVNIENIEIPTLYSIVGKDDSLFSIRLKNIEEDGVRFSCVSIFYYTVLTSSEKKDYQTSLLSKGYSLVNSDGLLMYWKNYVSENRFVLVKVSDLSVSYVVAEGDFNVEYQKFLESNL